MRSFTVLNLLLIKNLLYNCIEISVPINTQAFILILIKKNKEKNFIHHYF